MLLSFDLGIKNMGACALKNNGEIVAWELININSTKISDIVLSLDSWISCVLSNNTEIPIQVVLERQPWRNRKTTRLLVMMETFFTVAYPAFIVNKVLSNNKWKYINMIVPDTYNERKSRIIDVCKYKLSQSHDNNKWLEWYCAQQKKDDLADAYVQALALCYQC